MAKKTTLTYKQVGRNLNVNIDGETFTKVGTKDELAPIKEALKAYDEKPLVKNLKAIQTLLKPVSVKKEEEKTRIKAEIKRQKRTPASKAKALKEETPVQVLERKIKAGEVTESELDSLRKLIGKQEKQQESLPKTTPSKAPYRGEY